MGWAIRQLYNCPPFPPVELGPFAKMTGAEAAIREAWTKCYAGAWKDGFLTASIVWLLIFLLIQHREKLTYANMSGFVAGVVAKLFAAALVASLVLTGAAYGQGRGVPNGPVHDGHEVACDIPMPLRVRNTVGVNGMGLCVWASTQMMSNYLNCRELDGLFDAMKRRTGGGWPARVDKVMAEMAPGVKYRQYLGGDLDFVREGIDSGRPVCVTYGYGELYGMRTIAHMVICVSLDDQYAAVVDNNDPGRVWWMETAEFKRRFGWPRGSGWAWYILLPPPPPVPRN